jgi:hypothetical protein
VKKGEKTMAGAAGSKPIPDSRGINTRRATRPVYSYLGQTEKMRRSTPHCAVFCHAFFSRVKTTPTAWKKIDDQFKASGRRSRSPSFQAFRSNT